MEPFDLQPDPTSGAALVPQVDAPLGASPVAPDFSQIAPPPSLTAPRLALLPQASIPIPAPPGPVSNDPKQKLLALLALGLLAGSGPRSGVGVGAAQGLMAEQAQAEAERQKQYQFHVQQAQQQRAEQEKQLTLQAEQQRAAAARDEQRYRQYMTALGQFSTRATSGQIPTKDQYDQEVTAFANRAALAGYRGQQTDPNFIRTAAQYVAPKAGKAAADAVNAFLKNPANATLLQEHPDQLSKVVLTFDVDGDGIPEQVPLLRAAQVGGVPFSVDASGKVLSYPKGTTLDDKANADGIYADLLDKAKREGKDVTDPDVRLPIRQQAIKKAEDLKAKPPTDKLTKVEHKDPTTGKTVIEWLPESQLAGKTFEKGASATVENRLASAEAVTQTGNDIITKLSDPAYAKQVGVAMGRYNSMRDFIGNPPPEYTELAGQIESYSLASMGVHGMRSAQGAEQIKKMLDQKHTPQSLIAAIKGLNAFSAHFMTNEGRTTPTSPPTTPQYLSTDPNAGQPVRGRGAQ